MKSDNKNTSHLRYEEVKDDLRRHRGYVTRKAARRNRRLKRWASKSRRNHAKRDLAARYDEWLETSAQGYDAWADMGTRQSYDNDAHRKHKRDSRIRHATHRFVMLQRLLRNGKDVIAVSKSSLNVEIAKIEDRDILHYQIACVNSVLRNERKPRRYEPILYVPKEGAPIAPPKTKFGIQKGKALPWKWRVLRRRKRRK